MLIPTIAFDVYKNGQESHFLVENTADNYELIAQQHNTRNIEFTQTFDFQFARERKAPKFIEFGNAVLASYDHRTDSRFDTIDDVDEMVGTF